MVLIGKCKLGVEEVDLSNNLLGSWEFSLDKKLCSTDTYEFIF